MTGFTPDAPVLHEIKNHSEELAKAEAGVAAFAAKRNNRWYPKFHIASNGGWINDPNGLCFYKGRWHVFYQLHPYGTQWGPMHWGHVSSTDMVNWKREPIMFAPSLEEEKDGVFSGSAVIGDDGKLRFYYTGHRWANGKDNTGGDWQVQMLAEPDNDELTSATKRGMVIDCPTDKVNHHYRDPKVWKTGDKWYMTFGVSSAEKRGQMWLFSSDDMVKWTYEQVLFEHPDPDVFMLECPDFFPIKDVEGNEKWVIGFSAMGAKASGFMNRNVSNAGYMIGTWTPGEAFQPETEFRLWDCGHNYYAPQSFNDGERQIVYGWMSPFVEPIPMQDDGWCGNLTLPREITLGADGDLHTAPVAEMEGLREDTVDFGAIDLDVSGEKTIVDDAEAVEIEMTIDRPTPPPSVPACVSTPPRMAPTRPLRMTIRSAAWWSTGRPTLRAIAATVRHRCPKPNLPPANSSCACTWTVAAWRCTSTTAVRCSARTATRPKVRAPSSSWPNPARSRSSPRCFTT